MDSFSVGVLLISVISWVFAKQCKCNWPVSRVPRRHYVRTAFFYCTERFETVSKVHCLLTVILQVKGVVIVFTIRTWGDPFISRHFC